MVRARHSRDRWATYAHRILDRAQKGAFVKPNHVDWALAYLGDADGCTKIPADLFGGHRHRKAVIA